MQYRSYNSCTHLQWTLEIVIISLSKDIHGGRRGLALQKAVKEDQGTSLYYRNLILYYIVCDCRSNVNNVTLEQESRNPQGPWQHSQLLHYRLVHFRSLRPADPCTGQHQYHPQIPPSHEEKQSGEQSLYIWVKLYHMYQQNYLVQMVQILIVSLNSLFGWIQRQNVNHEMTGHVYTQAGQLTYATLQAPVRIN